MRRLSIPDTLVIPDALRETLRKLVLDIHDEDAMYLGDDRHYLSVGASALGVILAGQMLAGTPAPRRILDFGAGAGRVTRWVSAAFPSAEAHACDLRTEDMNFVARAFNVRTWISGTDIDALHAPASYDLIWLGSVATHLSAERTERLLDKMLSWTNQGGLVAISLHGRYARSRPARDGFNYFSKPERWSNVLEDYAMAGFGYADYEDMPGYGISLTKLSWAASMIERRPGIRLVTLSERVWDDHHDVLIVQNRAP